MITVLTTAIPKRLPMLAEALASVRAQTLLPACHVVHCDYDGVGTVASLNRLLRAVDTEYVALLADDDLFYPQHLQRLRETIGDNHVAYSYCDCDGQIPHVYYDGTNFGECAIAATALIRTSVIHDVGGWRTDRGNNSCEDFRMWDAIRARYGEKFVCVPEITWRYRFHGDNQSREGLTSIY